MSAELAGLAGLFLFAAAWEIAGMRGGVATVAGLPRKRDTRRGELRDKLAVRFEVGPRLERAGVATRVSARRFAGAKLVGAGIGLVAAIVLTPDVPGRLAPFLAVALVGAGFAGPDAWAERLARQRRRAIVSALADALDLVAVGTAAGRAPVALFSEIATGTVGPLASELALAVADIEAGAGQTEALAALRARTGTPELGAVSAAMERSRRYGSPLAEELHAQARSLRREEQRRIQERAARAAPKIQLFVAMVLVPSALLAIAAALVANSGALFAAF